MSPELIAILAVGVALAGLILQGQSSLGRRLDKRMDGLEVRMDGLDKRMDRLEGRMDRLEARMDSLDERLRAVEAGSGGDQRPTHHRPGLYRRPQYEAGRPSDSPRGIIPPSYPCFACWSKKEAVVGSWGSCSSKAVERMRPLRSPRTIRPS